VWGRIEDAPAPANSDEKVEPDVEVPASAAASVPERAAPVSRAPETGYLVSAEDEEFFAALSQPAASEDDKLDFGAAFKVDDPPSAEPAQQPDAASRLKFDDPIAALIAEQERKEAERAAWPATRLHTTVPISKPSPAVAIEPVVQHSDLSPIAKKPATPEQGQAAGEEDVLSLLRAMSEPRQAPPAAAQVAKAPGPEKAESHFVAPHVFGRSTPKAPTPPASPDPLDEIESLIGDAVRLSRDETRQSSSSRTEPEVNLDDAAYAAEAAIAAAAAETARPMRPAHKPEARPAPQIASLDSAMSADIAAAAPKRAKPLSNRLIVGAAAAATILVAVALGLFWLFGPGAEVNNGIVPVLTSNTADAKVPVEQNTTTAEASQPAMFNELDGTTAATPADEQIVSRDQSADITNDVRQVATPETVDESLANRKVRTVTVRPDGTIVSNEDTVAANEVLPVDRPNVPALSGETVTAEDFQVTTTPADTDAQPVAAASTEIGADPLAGIVSSAVAESAAETAVPSGEIVADAPYPAERPADAAFVVASAPAATTTTTAPAASSSNNTIDLIAGAANQVASQLPATTTAPPQTTAAVAPPPAATTTTAPATTTTPAGGEAPAYVQLSSQRSEEAAAATLASITQRYNGLFNGAEPEVRRVDLGDRGIYYRVLVPANSLNDAAGVCASVKSAGGDCFVRNN
jgi:hypothetical protein